MRTLKIDRLRVWNPHSARVIERWFFRHQALLGSDRKCAIRLKEMSGLVARVDFKTGEIVHIESGKIEKIKKGDLFQVGSYVVQWTEINLSKRLSIGVVCGGISMTIFLLALLFWNVDDSKPCSADYLEIAKGPWRKKSVITSSLFDRRQNFRAALEEKSWVKALAELKSMQEIVDPVLLNEACRPAEAFENAELEFSEHIVKDFIAQNDLRRAAAELRRSSHLSNKDRWQKLRRSLLKSARAIYIKGYRLEEDNSESAEDLMDSAEEVCAALSLSYRCFLKQTSHQKDPSHGRQSLE